MSQPIPSYRLKFERAKRHVRELATEVQAFLVSQPYELFTEDNASTGQRHYKVRVKTCVPAEWSMIIGDVIHNVRTALDPVEVVKFCEPSKAGQNTVGTDRPLTACLNVHTGRTSSAAEPYVCMEQVALS